MRRPGFEPGFWAWKAQVIAARPSTQTATHLEVFVIYNLFAVRVSSRENKELFAPQVPSYRTETFLLPSSISGGRRLFRYAILISRELNYG